MDDLGFVSTACEVPAPGAKMEINWVSEMAKAIGREFVVRSTSASLKAVSLDTEGKLGMGRDFWFPFTVLTMVRPPVT